MKKILAFILLSTFMISFTYSTDYYFSYYGHDDLNTGTSAVSPYKTIAKLNTLILKAGDKVLFKRGETFSGLINVTSSGTPSSFINFDSYGNGSNPIISGAIRVVGWRIYSGNIYVADIHQATENITQLSANGTIMTLARYPNFGYLTINSASGKSGISSNMLSQVDGYWDGANLIARTQRWYYENRIVASYKVGALQVTSPTVHDFKSGNGFFLNNKLSELDSVGEWYHDVQAKKIYFMPSSQVNPNNLKIEASIYNYGFNINKQNYITISNLSLCNQGLDGIYIYGCSNISISNNLFAYAFRNGIWSGYQGGTNIRVINNTFKNIGNSGIEISHSTFSTVQGNTLKNIALNPLISGGASGIQVGADSYISNNILDSIGYNGIGCGSRDTIAFNYIKNICLLKDDGAGIYFYKSDHLVVNNNIVINSIGNGTATPNKHTTFAHGIYLDDSSSYCTINNNTIVNADYGIFLHNSFNNTIQRNTLYNNRKTQLNLQNDHKIGKDNKENVVTENIFFSLHPDQYNVILWNYRSSIKESGTFDRNIYCNPYSNILIKTISAPYYPAGTLQKSQMYTFNDWQESFDQDLGSSIVKPNLGSYYNVQTLSGNLVSNSTFEKITGWYRWGSPGFSIGIDPANTSMNGNSLMAKFSNSAYDSKGYLAGGSFPVVEGNYYKLSFKANSIKTSNIEFNVTQSELPYTNAIAQNTCLLIKSSASTIDHIFKSVSSFSGGRIYFATTGYDSTLWIDDVSLMEVSVDTNSSMPAASSPIFINPTSVTKTIRIGSSFIDLNGRRIRRYISLPPFSSKIYTRSGLIFRESYSEVKKTNSVPLPDIILSPAPTPSGNNIYAQYPESMANTLAQYVIHDLSGKEINRGSAAFDSLNRIELATTDLPAGFYIIKMTTGTTIQTAKIHVLD